MYLWLAVGIALIWTTHYVIIYKLNKNIKCCWWILSIPQVLVTSALVYFICTCNKNQVLVLVFVLEAWVLVLALVLEAWVLVFLLVLEAWALVLVLEGLGTCFISGLYCQKRHPFWGWISEPRSSVHRTYNLLIDREAEFPWSKHTYWIPLAAMPSAVWTVRREETKKRDQKDNASLRLAGLRNSAPSPKWTILCRVGR